MFPRAACPSRWSLSRCWHTRAGWPSSCIVPARDGGRCNGGRCMEILLEQLPGSVTLVRLEGRLDLISAAELKERLGEAVTCGQSRLVIDLEAVPFIDSSGLG